MFQLSRSYFLSSARYGSRSRKSGQSLPHLKGRGSKALKHLEDAADSRFAYATAGQLQFLQVGVDAGREHGRQLLSPLVLQAGVGEVQLLDLRAALQ